MLFTIYTMSSCEACGMYITHGVNGGFHPIRHRIKVFTIAYVTTSCWGASSCQRTETQRAQLTHESLKAVCSVAYPCRALELAGLWKKHVV